MLNAKDIVDGYWQHAPIQDEQVFLDSRDVTESPSIPDGRDIKSVLQRRAASTFFFRTATRDLRRWAYPHEQYPPLYRSKQQEELGYNTSMQKVGGKHGHRHGMRTTFTFFAVLCFLTVFTLDQLARPNSGTDPVNSDAAILSMKTLSALTTRLIARVLHADYGDEISMNE